MGFILERRLTARKWTSMLKKVIPFFVGLILFKIVMEILKRSWLPEHRETLGWIEIIVFLVAMSLFVYWVAKTMKSVAKPFRAGETYYEGWAFNAGILILFGFSLFLGVPYFLAGLFLYLQGWNAALLLLIFGSLFLALAVFSLMIGFRTKLFVEKEGVLLKLGVLPFSPPIYFSFDEVGSVELWGPILSFKGTKQRPRWLIVQNRKKLASALDIVLERE